MPFEDIATLPLVEDPSLRGRLGNASVHRRWRTAPSKGRDNSSASYILTGMGSQHRPLSAPRQESLHHEACGIRGAPVCAPRIPRDLLLNYPYLAHHLKSTYTGTDACRDLSAAPAKAC